MSKEVTFSQAKDKNLKTLMQYVPVVARVHGGTHPEFYEVRELFDTIVEKLNDSGSDKPSLNKEFSELRKVTDHYTVPGDVCESYEAVYTMLAELDKAYFV